MENFNQFNISEDVKRALTLLGYDKPTNIQQQAIPAILEGKHLIIKSKTGSGKTAAFSIPLIEKLIWDKKAPQVLVLSPTRELAMQIAQEAFNIGRFKRIKVACLYGKSAFDKQEKILKTRNHIIVSTPGRLLDHINRQTVDLKMIDYLVIDEADEMLKMGFIEQIDEIIEHLEVKQVIMISATIDERTIKIINRYTKDSVLIEEDSDEQDKLKQFFMIVEEDKTKVLAHFIKNKQIASAIIFCNTQERVEAVYTSLAKENMLVDRLHGGLEQRIRTQTMNKFKIGKIRYLVATDVAARGIDVTDIAYVINYEMPEEFKTYVHRVGRTARMGKNGAVLTLLSTLETEPYIALMHQNDYLTQAVTDTPQVNLTVEDHLLEPLKLAKRDEALTKEIFKIHINAGKKTKMRASDIVGTICSLAGLTATDIGVISILDISTFVEIMNGKGPYVLEQLQTKTIKGRLRTVSKVEQDIS